MVCVFKIVLNTQTVGKKGGMTWTSIKEASAVILVYANNDKEKLFASKLNQKLILGKYE